MDTKRILTYIAASLALAACTYPFEADIQSDDDILVFEGDIVIGGESTISVSRVRTFGDNAQGGSYHYTERDGSSSSSYYPSYSDVYIEEAVVECEDGTMIIVPETMGSSISIDTGGLDPDKAYRIRMKVGGKEYCSEWTKAEGEAPVIDDINYEIIGDSHQPIASFLFTPYVRFRISAHSDESPYFRFQLQEEYEFHAIASTFFEYLPPESRDPDDTGRIVERDTLVYPYTCWSNPMNPYTMTISAVAYEGGVLDNYPILSIECLSQKISVLYHLKIQANTLSKNSYEYWQNLDKVSYPDGDLFTPTPSSMRGNIVRTDNEDVTVLGYIGVSKVTVGDIWFSNRTENFYRTPPSLTKDLTLVDYYEEMGLDSHNWPSMFAAGIVPYYAVYSETGFAIDHWTWIPRRCVDCTYNAAGATTEKPAGWPN